MQFKMFLLLFGLFVLSSFSCVGSCAYKQPIDLFIIGWNHISSLSMESSLFCIRIVYKRLLVCSLVYLLLLFIVLSKQLAHTHATHRSMISIASMKCSPMFVCVSFFALNANNFRLCRHIPPKRSHIFSISSDVGLTLRSLFGLRHNAFYRSDFSLQLPHSDVCNVYACI